jgi:6-phosphogluconate dehydrogenase
MPTEVESIIIKNRQIIKLKIIRVLSQIITNPRHFFVLCKCQQEVERIISEVDRLLNSKLLEF